MPNTPDDTNSLTHKTILLVEDDRFISKVYEKWLSAAGAVVLVAHDGEQGLRYLDTEKIDMVLLDLGMPGLDGYEMLKRIREKPHQNALPVIVLSNTTVNEDKEGFKQLREAGVKDILRKYEVSLTEIVDRIKTYFPE